MTARQRKLKAPRRKVPLADRLVHIEPSHLRAAMDEGSWTPSSIARRMEELRGGRVFDRRQTVHAMMLGDKTKRCRQSRRDLLAAALDVPAGWLGGESVDLPYGAGRMFDELAQRSPRVALAALRLATRCARVCAVELGVSRKQAAQMPQPEDPRHEVVNSLTWGLLALINVGKWRRHFLSPLGVEVPSAAEAHGLTPPWHTSPKVWSKREEEAALGMVRALTYMLDPWLQREARLNYERIRELIALAEPMFEVWLPHAAPPDVPFVERDGRRVVRDALSPFAVRLWWPVDASARGISPG